MVSRIVMGNSVGVVDEPIGKGGEDKLDLGIHAKSLIRYIKHTSTPITIGIQGEWGSGKTSLINSIYHDLSGDNSCKQIWINAWEFSLLSTPEESLLKIVTRIIDELLDSDTQVSKKDTIKKSAETIFKGALRVGAGIAGGNEAAKVATELFSESAQNIGDLRNKLSDLVKEIESRPTNPYSKIVIYVDDLDRIVPKNAVAILELLKNIFSLPNCVFILAIDYQVVVKGLEDRFGRQNADNEWEFRAFFDKIIQLPFMMPMGQYNIGRYVNKLLMEIKFVETGLDVEAIREIIARTIGGNPRSIKRLVNSISLINIFTEEKRINEQQGSIVNDDITEEKKKLLLFALLCLQIAYPLVYDLLIKEPDFTLWDDEFAFTQTKKKEESYEEFSGEYAIACESEDFDEDWERALYKICYVTTSLKNRVHDISIFFSYIINELLENKVESAGVVVAEILSETSVTSVNSTDIRQSDIPKREGKFQRRYLDGVEQWITDKESSSNAESLELVKMIHDELATSYPSDHFKYTKDISLFLDHRYMAMNIKGRKKTVILKLLRHPCCDYRIPVISGVNSSPILNYKPGKPGTARYSQQYSIEFNMDSFVANREEIIQLIGMSRDVSINYWGARLNIDVKKMSVTGKGLDVTNDEEKLEELATKYLSADYTIDANLFLDDCGDP